LSLAPDASVAERAACLREFGIWSALSDPVLQAAAAAMQPAAYAAGAFIIRQGEPGRHLHVLICGEAEVRVHAANGTVIPVATMSAGACFGEMSLLSGDVTSADVVAAADCLTLTLDRAAFEALVASQPQLLREFVRMVSRRLFDSNVAMGAAREREKGLTRFLQEVQTDQEGELVGKLPAVRALQRQIETQSPADGPLLIQGERGTGKELVARLIHFRGPRREAPLLCTDCSQIAETPWGDKLFGGYGSGPGDQGPSHVSYLALAAGGTIVLKNVDALPRAIQERLAEHIAAESRQPSRRRDSVRIIATCRASFQDLAAAAKVSPALAGALGTELLVIPPLRERKRDIPELAAYFTRKHARRLGKPLPSLDDQAVSKLVTYDYPIANVNELEEAIRRAVVVTDGPSIEAEAVFLGQPPPPSRWALNLLTFDGLDTRAAFRLVLRSARIVVAAVFAGILYASLFGPVGPGNWGTLLVWSIGWPLLVASFFLGRAGCAVCPMPTAAKVVQRAFNVGWKTPAWLTRHDGTIVMAGFFAIIWAEEATRMRGSPRATAVLLLSILAGAVVTAVLMPRRAWCRHLCPMGGFLGAGAMAGLVELRPTPDICGAKCRDHSCFKGSEAAEGCPLFNHVMFVDSNQHCVLCLQCVDACPNDSPQLNLRLPARDLVTAADRTNAGRWTAMLSGLLVALVLLQQWDRQAAGALAGLLQERRVLFVTAVLAVGALVPQLLLHLVARRLGASARAAGAAALWQKVAAWMPVVLTGFLAHQLAFIAAFEGVRVAVGTHLANGQATGAVSVSLLAVVQATLLGAGLLVTVAVLWNLRQPAGEVPARSWWRDHAVGLGGGAAYWTLLVLLMLR
jgi:transcriptional regulator with AAA-type ATPase domain/polyferredoxin